MHKIPTSYLVLACTCVTVGCQRAPSPPTLQPAAPPPVWIEKKAQSFPEDPALQSLVDAGAHIEFGHGGLETEHLPKTFVTFEHTRITREALAAVRAVRGRVDLSIVSSELAPPGCLAELNGLDDLCALGIGDTPIDDTAFHEITALPGLEILALGGSGITSRCLRFLPACQNLRIVSLNATDVDDAAIAYISNHPDLQRLSLARTRVTDHGLLALKGLPGLRCLSVGGCNITDRSLAALGQITSLESLGLAKTGISDAGLAHLAPLTGLRFLGLGGTPITDAAIPRLMRFHKLDMLQVGNTAVTDKGLGPLAEQMPTTYIDAAGIVVTGAKLPPNVVLGQPQGGVL